MKRSKKYPPGHDEILAIFKLLSGDYPDFKTELTYESPFQLLVAVILSAQCTDARVNQTTPALFQAYPDAVSLAKAPRLAVEKLIHSCGFYRMKAQNIQKMAEKLIHEHGGEVPSTLDELHALPGVGRKTASVVLNQAFNEPAIAVDTHVKRVAYRLGWTNETDPVKVEMDLRKLLPQEMWTRVNGTLILHGRRVCNARKPLCEECHLASFCRFCS